MDEIWDDPKAHFFCRLYNTRVDQFISDPAFLRSLRTDWKMYSQIMRLMGHIFEERGLCLHDLIMQACACPDERLRDEEDEEKERSLLKSRVSWNGRISPAKKKICPWVEARDCHFLPLDLVRLIAEFAQPDEPEPEPKPEPPVVPEWQNGMYGHVPVRTQFPVFA